MCLNLPRSRARIYQFLHNVNEVTRLGIVFYFLQKTASFSLVSQDFNYCKNFEIEILIVKHFS